MPRPQILKLLYLRGAIDSNLLVVLPGQWRKLANESRCSVGLTTHQRKTEKVMKNLINRNNKTTKKYIKSVPPSLIGIIIIIIIIIIMIIIIIFKEF